MGKNLLKRPCGSRWVQKATVPSLAMLCCVSLCVLICKMGKQLD